MIVAIAGARGKPGDPKSLVERAREWASARGAEVLLADARIVFGKDHVESAVAHALRSQRTGTMATRSLSMEILLYLSGKRQVSEALSTAGVREDTTSIAVVLLGNDSLEDLLGTLGWARDDAVLDPRGKSLRALGIRQREERTVPPPVRTDLALERVALVDLLK